MPTLADHGVRDEHPDDVKILAEPSGAERSAQFVRPALRFVALIRVDSLEGAAVELGVADVVATQTESADRDAAVDGTLVDRGTGGTRLTPLSRSVWTTQTASTVPVTFRAIG